jgi:hypothetical protein
MQYRSVPVASEHIDQRAVSGWLEASELAMSSPPALDARGIAETREACAGGGEVGDRVTRLSTTTRGFVPIGMTSHNLVDEVLFIRPQVQSRDSTDVRTPPKKALALLGPQEREGPPSGSRI